MSNVYDIRSPAQIAHRDKLKVVFHPRKLRRWKKRNPEEARMVEERYERTRRS